MKMSAEKQSYCNLLMVSWILNFTNTIIGCLALGSLAAAIISIVMLTKVKNLPNSDVADKTNASNICNIVGNGFMFLAYIMTAILTLATFGIGSVLYFFVMPFGFIINLGLATWQLIQWYQLREEDEVITTQQGDIIVM